MSAAVSLTANMTVNYKMVVPMSRMKTFVLISKNNQLMPYIANIFNIVVDFHSVHHSKELYLM